MTSLFSLRAVTSTDLPFLQAVYASTREVELALVDWDHARKAAFLAMQFQAQHRHYLTNYTDTAYCVIQSQNQDVGRLYVARWPSELRIVELALLPAFRNRGIGGDILRSILREADAAGKPVSVHVEQQNPARALYERHGFVPVDTNGVYLLMQRPPANPHHPDQMPGCLTACR